MLWTITRCLTCLALTFFLGSVACSRSTGVSEALVEVKGIDRLNPRGLMPDDDEADAQAANGTLSPGSPEVAFQGGKILSSASVRAVFWGPRWKDLAFVQDKIAGIENLFQGFAGSFFLNALTQLILGSDAFLNQNAPLCFSLQGYWGKACFVSALVPTAYRAYWEQDSDASAMSFFVNAVAANLGGDEIGAYNTHFWNFNPNPITFPAEETAALIAGADQGRLFGAGVLFQLVTGQPRFSDAEILPFTNLTDFRSALAGIARSDLYFKYRVP